MRATLRLSRPPVDATVDHVVERAQSTSFALHERLERQRRQVVGPAVERAAVAPNGVRIASQMKHRHGCVLDEMRVILHATGDVNRRPARSAEAQAQDALEQR